MKITTLLLTSALLATSLTVSADSKEYIGLIGPVTHYNTSDTNITNNTYGVYYRKDLLMTSVFKNSYGDTSFMVGLGGNFSDSDFGFVMGIASGYEKASSNFIGFAPVNGITYRNSGVVITVTPIYANVAYEFEL